MGLNTSHNHTCWMCGNPRKYFKEKTVQEKKSDMDFKDQLLDGEDYWLDLVLDEATLAVHKEMEENEEL